MRRWKSSRNESFTLGFSPRARTPCTVGLVKAVQTYSSASILASTEGAAGLMRMQSFRHKGSSSLSLEASHQATQTASQRVRASPPSCSPTCVRMRLSTSPCMSTVVDAAESGTRAFSARVTERVRGMEAVVELSVDRA